MTGQRKGCPSTRGLGPNTPRLTSRSGFTLLELLMATTLLAVLLGSTVEIVDSARRALGTSARTENESARTTRAVGRVASYLETAGRATLLPNPVGDFGAASVSFQRPSDLTAAGVVWGAIDRIGFEYDALEVDDGADNDGDGLIDEGVLVLTRNVGEANERRTVLCSDVTEIGTDEAINGLDDDGDGVVDEGGFNVHRVGDVLHLRVCVERLFEGELIQTQAETSLRLRN